MKFCFTSLQTSVLHEPSQCPRKPTAMRWLIFVALRRMTLRILVFLSLSRSSLGGDLVVSSTRCVARFHWVLHPDRHVGRRLHFLRNGFWSTSLPGIHGRKLFYDVLLFISCALSNSRWFVFGENLWRREQALWVTSYSYIELQNIQNLDWSPKTMGHWALCFVIRRIWKTLSVLFGQQELILTIILGSISHALTRVCLLHHLQWGPLCRSHDNLFLDFDTRLGKNAPNDHS